VALVVDDEAGAAADRLQLTLTAAWRGDRLLIDDRHDGRFDLLDNLFAASLLMWTTDGLSSSTSSAVLDVSLDDVV
jgi:hypothetical protein